MALKWGYSKDNGPETWCNEFPDANGCRQSPIDIQHINLKNLTVNKKLTWGYIAENTIDVGNTGYCWKVNVDGKESELTGGPLMDKYVLKQFHCHWGATDDEGSEHTINGQRYAGELHLVHWNSTKYGSFEEAAKHPDGLCVIGVFLKPGQHNDELHKIVNQLPKIEFRGQHAKLEEPLNPGLLIPIGSGYYTYEGSLTTPPCSECVIWVVFKDPIEVSKEQLEVFRSLKNYAQDEICLGNDDYQGFVKCNYRPTLPVGPRDIHECPH